jgi:DNA replication protein DnaC
MKSVDEILKASAITDPMNTPISSSDNIGDNTQNDSQDHSPSSSASKRSRESSNAAAKRSTSSLLDDTCPRCGGAGYVVLDVPVSHPDFGKAVSCTCRQSERLQKRVRLLQERSSLTALQRLTFESFIPEPSHLGPAIAYNVHRAYDTCIYYAQEPEGWLVITGSYGCGKTHLAAAIANARVAMGEPAIFMVIPDLLDHLRSAYNPQSEMSYDDLFEQLRNTPLLILDDLGTQSSTPWAQEKLFQLLNHRYIARLPTVITTNQRIDELEPRLRSRLHDPNLVTVFAIVAPDFRTGKNASQTTLSTLRLYQDKSFENFDLRRSELAGNEYLNLQEIVNRCVHFADQPQAWLVLAGTYGSGKTHLAAAIANKVMEHAESEDEAMFVVVPDLLDHLRSAFSPQSNISYDRLFDAVKNSPMLVLDDLGTESATPWAKEKLFQLLNYRYSALLPTVITTSSTPNEIEPWLRTRMLDTARCQFCGIDAPAYRRSRTENGKKSYKGK